MGYPINESLPLLDAHQVVRNKDEVVDRLLAMFVLGAVAYGFDAKRAREWLGGNAKIVTLTPSEESFLKSGKGPTQAFRSQIEGLWALYWCCGLTERFVINIECPQDFVDELPDIRRDENAVNLRLRAKLIADTQIMQMADVAYCVHWAVVDCKIRKPREKIKFPEFAIRERRRALEWMLHSESWDEISLDT
jgi:hypothetical protein